jgi:hypothetical protein
VSDIDTTVVDSLKVLDPKRPIREADIDQPLHELFSRSLNLVVDDLSGFREGLGRG